MNMLTEKLKTKIYTYAGFPQIIPAEQTPEGVYEKNCIGKDINERIKFWKQTYSKEIDFPKFQSETPKQILVCLENYYLQRLVTSGIEED